MQQYVEKLDLSGFVSLKDDCSRDRNLEAARLILQMKDGETKLTVSHLAHTLRRKDAKINKSLLRPKMLLLSFPGTKLGITGAVERIPLLCYRCRC